MHEHFPHIGFCGGEEDAACVRPPLSLSIYERVWVYLCAGGLTAGWEQGVGPQLKLYSLNTMPYTYTCMHACIYCVWSSYYTSLKFHNNGLAPEVYVCVYRCVWVRNMAILGCSSVVGGVEGFQNHCFMVSMSAMINMRGLRVFY